MISVITPTHDPKYLRECYESLKKQTYKDFEWVVIAHNCKVKLPKEEWIRIVLYNEKTTNIGEIKRFAFEQGRGDFLLEYDHDDLLSSHCLEEVAKAFDDTEIDFVYSDCADFSMDGNKYTYSNSEVRKGWEACGWKFYKTKVDGKEYEVPHSWGPSAQAVSLIFYAPNHVRAWRRSFYEKVGKHAPIPECDDHELLIRTYLNGKIKHIPKCLYLYRISGSNTWAQRIEKIREETGKFQTIFLPLLVKRECDLRGLQAVDLGGAFNAPKGWVTCDKENAEIIADLSKKWPFEDSSIGAFRAFDFLEHLPNKQHVMSELYRCLAPGGWLLSATPSTDGRGAFQDPTHVSYWNQNAFWYWTRKEQAQFIHNTDIRFMEARLFTAFPSDWHKENNIPYTYADMISLKNDDGSLPGIRRI